MIRFFKSTVTHDDGSTHDVEMIALPALGGDESTREATDADRQAYFAAYAEYLNPPMPEADKDAEIAALKARIAEMEARRPSQKQPGWSPQSFR